MTQRRVLLALLCGAVVALAPWVGAIDPEHREFILWQLRVPRVVVASLVGGVLGLAGAAFQLVLQNGLATPSTVGTTAGAALGALAVFALRPALPDLGLPAVTLAAFLGALGVTTIVSLIARRRGVGVGEVLLGGIAMTLAASALSSALRYVADPNALLAATQWSLGALPQVGTRGIALLVLLAGPASLYLLTQARALEVLAGGDDRAHSMGVDVPGLRSRVLAAGALAVAACVAWCGPIAFVGLIVPHAVRRLLDANPRTLLPWSFALGSALLVASDTAARLAPGGREIPVGVLTAALGAPTLLALIARGAHRGERN